MKVAIQYMYLGKVTDILNFITNSLKKMKFYLTDYFKENYNGTPFGTYLNCNFYS